MNQVCFIFHFMFSLVKNQKQKTWFLELLANRVVCLTTANCMEDKEVP